MSRALSAKYYHSPSWRRLRVIFLNKNPLCEICLKVFKKLEPANVVDHKEGWTDSTSFFDSSKWEALCKSCHSQKLGEDLAREHKKELLKTRFF